MIRPLKIAYNNIFRYEFLKVLAYLAIVYTPTTTKQGNGRTLFEKLCKSHLFFSKEGNWHSYTQTAKYSTTFIVYEKYANITPFLPFLGSSHVSFKKRRVSIKRLFLASNDGEIEVLVW